MHKLFDSINCVINDGNYLMSSNQKKRYIQNCIRIKVLIVKYSLQFSNYIGSWGGWGHLIMIFCKLKWILTQISLTQNSLSKKEFLCPYKTSLPIPDSPFNIIKENIFINKICLVLRGRWPYSFGQNKDCNSLL
jgi:hypothetical protein